MNLKEYIPASVKLFIKLCLISIKDVLNLDILKMVSVNGNRIKLPVQHTINQKIVSNEYVDNKIENLQLAADKINWLNIPPGKIFSFNRIAGNPSSKNGFKESRSIKNGKVVPEIGGGLCQLPWIMYHLCLQTGIKILERHHHSKDIYDATTRFAPLGSDATIVYGYKDFRIENNTNNDICFVFSIHQSVLSCSICCKHSIVLQRVDFHEEKKGSDKISVKTNIDGQFFTEDIYLI